MIKLILPLLLILCVGLLSVGCGSGSNDKESFEETEAKAEKGDDTAKKRFEEIKVKAENGNEISQYNLGIFYQNGIGVKQDFKQAVKWFRKSADQGYTRSQVNLGLMYNKGVGVK